MIEHANQCTWCMQRYLVQNASRMTKQIANRNTPILELVKANSYIRQASVKATLSGPILAIYQKPMWQPLLPLPSDKNYFLVLKRLLI